MGLPLETGERLRTVGHALEAFARVTRPVLPIRHMLVFLAVVEHEGLSPVELARRLGVSSSAMTRIIQELGPWNRKAEPGYGLVDYRIELTDRRFKPVVLTKKGRMLACEIAGALGQCRPSIRGAS